MTKKLAKILKRQCCISWLFCDFIRYFNLRFFFDLKLVIGGTVLNTNFKNSGDILIMAPYGVKRIKPNIFFKRIKTDDLFKMKLIQIANSV